MKLTFTVNQPLPVVFDYLADMQKFVTVHPVITRIEPGLNSNNYKINETLRMGPIPLRFTYSATVNALEKEQVVMHVAELKGVTLNIRFDLAATPNGTSIQEEIVIHTFQPLRQLLQVIFRKQHNKLFRNIDSMR
jgi:carbon monoxide dehydrogenase subunit G